VRELCWLTETNPIPTVLAFLICESVIHDAETQKKTLVGIFDRVLAGVAPTSLNLALYAKLVEGSGQYTFKLRMVNLKDESPVVQVLLQATWANVEGPFELGANFRGLVIPQFGSYEFQIYGNDVYLGRAVFRLDKVEFTKIPAA
jgi:hypothetical protein